MYEDTAVVEGERYAYRLAYIEEGEGRITREAWVDVPRAFELALEGFRPNPAGALPGIAFTLPSAGRAILEVVDVTGRRVFRSDVGERGPGRHTIAVRTEVPLAPGVYLIRLASGGRVMQARGVVLR